MVPPLVEEAHGVLQVGLKLSFQLKRFVVSINVRLTKIDEVDKHGKVGHELDRDGYDQAPMEDRGWRLLFVELLEGRVKAKHHENDGNAQAKVSGLIVAHLYTIQVQGAHRVC